MQCAPHGPDRPSIPQAVRLRKVPATQLRWSERLMGGVVMPLQSLELPWTRMELTPMAGTTWRDVSASPLRLVGRHGALDFADATLLTLLSGVQCPDDAPIAPRLELLRMGLARIPRALTEIMGGPFDVLAPDQETSAMDNELPCLLTLTEINGDSHTVLLKAAQDTLMQWVASAGWQRHAPDWRLPPLRDSALSKLLFTGGMHLGRVGISLRRLRGLQAGDALLIPSKDGYPSAPFSILLGSQLMKFSQSEDDSYVFQGWVVEVPPYSNPSHVKPIEKVFPTMDALKVDLDFIVGRLSMTVAELAAVAPGRILPLEVATPPRVRIVAHGTELGSGELIDVDGRLAVEIIDWGSRL